MAASGRSLAWRLCLCAVAFVASFDTWAVGGSGDLLYRAHDGVLPDQAPWQWNYLAAGAGSTRGMAGGVTFLDTTASTGSAGYGMLLGTPLDSGAGFHLDFALRIDAETHTSNHRAGFSLLVLDQSARGIELGFWTDQIWAQNAGAAPFTHGESIALDTQSWERTYRLTFLGDGYSLTSDGAPTLAGALRDYAAVATGPVAPFIYSQQNFIFFGDNTSSAAGRVELNMIALAPVPEPGEWALLLVGLATVTVAVRRRPLRPAS